MHILLALLTPSTQAADVAVATASELQSAVDNVTPGDIITLAPGDYALGAVLSCDTDGTASEPIVVRAEALGDAQITTDQVMAFRVSAPYWTFENLDIQGTCASHTNCEHAFQIVGRADHTTVRGSRLHDWNAQIKGNGEDVGDGMEWPDGVLIENTEFFSSTVRNTGNPVTPIDIVGGHDWIVRANFIHDHAKGQSDQISYAAFFKGHGENGLFERNLVVCEWLHSGGIRLGLSLGGGGSNPDFICEQSDCSIEHVGGTIRNNIVAHCPADVCLYLNEAVDSKVYNNTLYDCTGVDVRFSVSTADIRNNVLSGSIRERDGATTTLGTNLTNTTEWISWFTDPDNLDFGLVDGVDIVDQGEPLADVVDDFCTNDRDDGLNDLGAVEYDGDGPCDTTQPFVEGSGTGTGSPGTTTGNTDGNTTGGNPTPAGGTGPDDPLDGGADGGCGCSVEGSTGALAWILLLPLVIRRSIRKVGQSADQSVDVCTGHQS